MHQANKKAEFFHSALSTVFDKKGLLLYNNAGSNELRWNYGRLGALGRNGG